MNNELSFALSCSLSDDISRLANDLIEASLDSVIDDGLLKEIPILSTAVGFYKIGHSIYERHNIRKLSTFVSALNHGVTNDERQEYYKKRITDDSTTRSTELEFILILIYRYIRADKTEMLSKLYLTYLDNAISWLDFTKYAEVIDCFLPNDFDTLKSVSSFKTEREAMRFCCSF